MLKKLLFAVGTLSVMTLIAVSSISVASKRTVTELPEVLVESQKRNMLHVLAYVREYSQLTTYSDTITLFREKLVDFMIPGVKSKYRGWKIPRVLKSESYFRFTNADGLDSVSDFSPHHFSWSDWMGLPPVMEIPESYMSHTSQTDTIFGKFSPTETWTKNDDCFKIELNVLADTLTRRWVPTLRPFFVDEKMEFEDFKMNLEYDNVLGRYLMPRDLKRYTFHVDSNGRGHSMFRFNRRDEDFFATTDGEVYLLDLEQISERDARKWAKGKFNPEDIDMIYPMDASPLPEETLALIDRVNHIDKNLARLDFVPDKRMIRMERKRNWGQGALRYIKNILGISDAMAGRKQNANWKRFRDEVKSLPSNNK